jgi:nucleoside-diphosphate-sugar epimerase
MMENLINKTIAVTGATGFLGRYFVRELHAQGANVVAVVRNPTKVPELKRDGIELRIADLADRVALSQAFAHCDAVIANAGQVSMNPDYDELLRQNLDGTRNTLHACSDANVQRVITISSASVYQKIRSDIAIDETAPLRTAKDKRNRFSIYPISKAMAEQESWQLAQSLQLQMTAIRPYAIFGAFDQHSFSHWFEWLMRWPVLAPYPVGLNLPLIYAGDLARATCATLTTEKAIGEAFNVGGDNIDFWQFYNIWVETGGFHPALRIALPVPFKRLFNDNKIRNLTGWQPRDFSDTCRETLTIIQQQGHF